MTPKVSFIFPTFNGWQDTKECLKSITKLNYPHDKLEVIVIDNGSKNNIKYKILNIKCTLRLPSTKLRTSRSGQAYKKLNIILIQNKINLGFAKAVNAGIKKATGEYFLVTNNDVVFDKDYLFNLVLFLEKNPKVGIMGGKVYYKQPKEKIAFGGAKFDFYTGILKPNKKLEQIFETDWIPGCNLLIKRQVLEEIGNFDEKFFFYFEDLDLCLRAKRAGYKVIYYPRAVLYHGEGVSIDKEGWQKKSEYYYQGKTRILFKHATKIQLICNLLFQFTFGLIYQIVVLKHQNYSPAIKALIKNLKER